MRGVPDARHGYGREQKWIYTVTFYVNPRRRVHSFWLQDLEKAGRLYESVRGHPKVLDYAMYRTSVSTAGAYTIGMEDGGSCR